ncbi:MAG: hypothetical protein JWM34_1586 [Ilumatobacteraceae bacterium]|nr:hypothetical protein [Ilumatobacteraceae bacterium]
MCLDRRVAEWFADLTAAEQMMVRAEVAGWSPWLMNSLDESDIGYTELAAYLTIRSNLSPP